MENFRKNIVRLLFNEAINTQNAYANYFVWFFWNQYGWCDTKTPKTVQITNYIIFRNDKKLFFGRNWIIQTWKGLWKHRLVIWLIKLVKKVLVAIIPSNDESFCNLKFFCLWNYGDYNRWCHSNILLNQQKKQNRPPTAWMVSLSHFINNMKTI